MKRSIIIALFVLAPLSLSAKIVTDEVKSTLLDTTMPYNVYLPSDYNENGDTYPVIYLLHGLWGGYYDWQKLGNMSLVADELMASGECVKTVIIMPNAGGQRQDDPWYGYFNVPGWNYEDFFFTEFMPSVENKYRCGGEKGLRSIMGLSMGGGGSVVYSQRHPEIFSSCYCMSGWLDIINTDVKNDKFSKKVIQTRKSVAENSALKFIDNADSSTLKDLDSVRWMIDCGDDDSLLELSVNLHFKMKKAGINSELRVHNGRHNWEYWHLALRDALPFASRNFKK